MTDRHDLGLQLNELLRKHLPAWGFPGEPVVQSIIALVDGLKTFREEGRPFRPDVYVIRAEDGPALREIIATPNLERAVQTFLIDSAPDEPASYFTVLKGCAPLAVGEWNIIIRLEGDSRITFGLMRRPNSVIDESALEHLRGQEGEVPPFLLLRALSEDVVQITGRTGDPIELQFWGRPKRDILADQEFLLENLVRDVPWPNEKPRIRRLLSNAFREASTSGHGFLVAVQPYPYARALPAPDYCPVCTTEMQNPATPIAGLREDGVFFKDILPLALRVSDFVRSVSPERASVPRSAIDSYAQLRAWQDLVVQCLITDGVVLFDTCARLIGYRIFVRPAVDPHTGGKRTGARKRAFNYLRGLVETNELVACLYQSQDGATEAN